MVLVELITVCLGGKAFHCVTIIRTAVLSRDTDGTDATAAIEF